MAFQAKYDKGDKGRTHEESRQVICACCGKKVKKYNQTKAQTKVMSSKYEQLVKNTSSVTIQFVMKTIQQPSVTAAGPLCLQLKR